MRKMKLILFAGLLFWSSFSPAQSKNLGIDLGLGFQSNYGLIGAGGRYFLSELQDVHVSVGIDLSGLMVGAGSRFYFPDSDTRCLFIFSCKPRYFVGGTFLGANGTLATVDGDGVRGDYRKSDGLAANASFGSYDVFGKSFTMGIELGYRFWLKRPTVDFESGTYLQKHKDGLEDSLVDSISGAVTLGWLF